MTSCQAGTALETCTHMQVCTHTKMETHLEILFISSLQLEWNREIRFMNKHIDCWLITFALCQAAWMEVRSGEAIWAWLTLHLPLLILIWPSPAALTLSILQGEIRPYWALHYGSKQTGRSKKCCGKTAANLWQIYKKCNSLPQMFSRRSQIFTLT